MLRLSFITETPKHYCTKKCGAYAPQIFISWRRDIHSKNEMSDNFRLISPKYIPIDFNSPYSNKTDHQTRLVRQGILRAIFHALACHIKKILTLVLRDCISYDNKSNWCKY